MMDLIGQELFNGDVVIFNEPGSGYTLCLGRITAINSGASEEFAAVEYTSGQHKNQKTKLCKRHVFKPNIYQITEFLLKN